VQVALQRLPGLYLASTPLGDAASDVLVELDRSATWVRLPAGQTLFNEGDPSDALYVITHGSLEVLVNESGGTQRMTAVLGRRAFLGEMGLLLGEPRSATVRARRDSELIRIPTDAFERAINVEPKVGISLARQLARQLSRAGHEPPPSRQVHTIAVLPLDRSSETRALSAQLATALGGLHLTSARVAELERLPQLGSNDLADSRLRQWMSELEERYPYVVYVGDDEATEWTRLALRQADVVLLIASSAANPNPSEVERELVASAIHAPVELVLVHSGAATERVSGTSAWLTPRKLDAFHHVHQNGSDDVARLARSIRGTSIGLVLGGGGARGLAHIGVIRAMREAGLSIDRIAGTSMGAIIAAQYAMGHDASEILALTRRHYAEGGGSDLTLPMVALRSARQTGRTLRALFGDVRIEDLATPFFCVSADLTRAEVVVHGTGPLWLSVRASCAVPGVVPPVPYHGDLLVDGGLLNNLPTDIMRQRWPGGSLVAVDVSPRVDLAVKVEGLTEVSGWGQLWARMRPTEARAPLPTIFELLSRSVLLSSARDSQAMGRQADLYLRPPVDDVPMTAFKSIDDVVERGYRYAATQLEAWLRGRQPASSSASSSTLL
jgi:predicted acylesterase/phospholipase RssA/CRP-like cAMP-binding protein